MPAYVSFQNMGGGDLASRRTRWIRRGSGRGQGKNGGLVIGHVDVGAVAIRHVRGIMPLPCGGCPLRAGLGLGPWMNMTYMTADLHLLMAHLFCDYTPNVYSCAGSHWFVIWLQSKPCIVCRSASVCKMGKQDLQVTSMLPIASKHVPPASDMRITTKTRV